MDIVAILTKVVKEQEKQIKGQMEAKMAKFEAVLDKLEMLTVSR